jgi:hypothetical protein
MFGALVLAATATVPVLAHPIATTAMLLSLSERGVVVTIDSEGAPLLVKLEAFAHGEISSRETSAADRHAKLVELQHVLASALEIRADGVAVPLAVTSIEDALDVMPPRAVVTLVGGPAGEHPGRHVGVVPRDGLVSVDGSSRRIDGGVGRLADGA